MMRLVARVAFAVILAVPAGAAAGIAAASTGQEIGPPSTEIVDAPTGGERGGAEQLVNRNVPHANNAREEFSRAGATYIKVHFDRLRLAPGDFITVSDPAGREVYTYHGDPTRGGAQTGDADFTVHRSRGFAAMSVTGDKAVVTMHVGPTPDAGQAEGTGLGVHVDRFWRGFSADEFAEANPQFESICGADARRDRVCFRNSNPTEFALSSAVGRLIVGGGKFCTAWRVGASNRILTNNHCVSTSAGVRASEVQFGFECRTCGGNDPRPGVKVSGARLVRTSVRLDYTLFSVNDLASIRRFGTLFLDPRPPRLGEKIYIPGHGDAKPMTISIFKDEIGGAKCQIDVAVLGSANTGYNCDTTEGSSGSPVIASSSNKVIAIHHLRGCPNRGVRIELIFPEIENLIVNEPVMGPMAPSPATVLGGPV